MRFIEDAFSDPSNWEENPPQPAIEERVIDRPDADVEPEEIVEAEIVEPEGEPANDTPSGRDDQGGRVRPQAGAVTNKEQDHNGEPQPTGREDLQRCADAVEVRPADQHLVAQADRRLKQHRLVPDPPQPIPPVSRPQRRSLTSR